MLSVSVMCKCVLILDFPICEIESIILSSVDRIYDERKERVDLHEWGEGDRGGLRPINLTAYPAK